MTGERTVIFAALPAAAQLYRISHTVSCGRFVAEQKQGGISKRKFPLSVDKAPDPTDEFQLLFPVLKLLLGLNGFEIFTSETILAAFLMLVRRGNEERAKPIRMLPFLTGCQ